MDVKVNLKMNGAINSLSLRASIAYKEAYLFYVRVTVHRNNFFIIKPNRCTNFTHLFWHETLDVSDSSSVHNQDFIHCTLSSGICHTAFEKDQDETLFHPGPARKLSTNLYDTYHC